MSYVASPPPRPTSFTGDNPQQRVNFRLWQIAMSAITIVITIWFFTLNSLAGILALVVAKHVLVAILCAGLTKYPAAEGRQNAPPSGMPPV